MTAAAEALFEALRSLWEAPEDRALAALLPRDAETLAGFYPRLQEYVAAVPRQRAGKVDPQAIVRGDIVSMGEGSVIEAGAIVHESCRLVLGAGARVRSGAILRDEVVVGPDCLIGAHCELARSVVIGPRTYLGHFVFLGDSIVGREVMLAGGVKIANTRVDGAGTVRMRWRGESVDSGRPYLGLLAGDGVRLGGDTTVCPGCVVLPGLALPPHVVLYGTIDTDRRRALFDRFFADWGDGGARC
jgi:NDP-sugar pyrophosphorylase family protein